MNFVLEEIMNICLLGKTCDPKTGGIGRHIFELAKRLAESEHEVTVVVREGESVPDIEGADFAEVSYRELGPEVLNNYSCAWGVYKYLKEHGENFDIVHGHEVYGALAYKLKQEQDYNFVYTVHGVAYNLISRERLRPLAKFLHLPERVAVKNSDKTIAVSENTKKEVLEDYRVEEEKVDVLYNGVDTGRFRPVYEEFQDRILFVGEFLGRKGPDLVVDSFSSIASEFPNVDLVLVGGGRLRSGLEDQVEELSLENRVSFREDISDNELIELYSGSVFVMPSSYEGQGIVYVEALSCGAPAIGCDNSATPEMIEDGVNGFLVDRNVEDISEALSKVLDSDGERWSEMSVEARESASRFDWDNIADQTLELYEKL